MYPYVCEARFGHSMVYTGDSIYIFGGINFNEDLSDFAHIFEEDTSMDPEGQVTLYLEEII